MITGLSEFDEPEAPIPPASQERPLSPASSTDSGEQPERRVCRIQRCSTEYTCQLPHCAVCDGHFDPGKHTEATMCPRCYAWQKLEGRMTVEQREQLRILAARLAAVDTQFEAGVRG